MKLYYSPGACSLAPHIALGESGIPYATKIVDLKKHALADGTDYYTINPKGYVPLLELDDGEHLSEVAVILQYIADRKPGTLAPAFGSMERYRLMECQFHRHRDPKLVSPLWYPTTPS
jgi:glutathione S-transferase